MNLIGTTRGVIYLHGVILRGVIYWRGVIFPLIFYSGIIYRSAFENTKLFIRKDQEQEYYSTDV